jgi:hypothetical protein
VDAAAVAWAQATIGAITFEPRRVRPWSELGCLSTNSAVWWLKVSKAGTRYEGPLLRVLAETGHRLLPDVIVHQRRPWILIADAGERLLDLSVSPPDLVELWCQVVIEYAELQQKIPVDAALAAGVPDFRSSRLPQRYEELLDGHQWFSKLAASSLTVSERELARTFLPRLERLAAELGEGPPATVQHDDVHETNVVIDPRHLSHPRLIDWGDAVVGHPFCSMGVTLDRLADQLVVPLSHPWIMRVIDAYLEQWRADGWPRRWLLRQMRIGRRLDHILRAHAWLRGVGNLQAAQTVGFAESPGYWIRRLTTPAA